MSEVHGIENDTTNPTNSTLKHPLYKLAHTLRLKEIFSFYDPKLVKVKPGKGNAIRRILGEHSHSTKIRVAHQVFIKGMELMIKGVVNRKFIFNLPFKNLDVKLKIINTTKNQSKGLFKYYRGIIDPFDYGFELYRAVLQVKCPYRPDILIPVSLSPNLYDIMMNNKRKRLSYENSKIADINDLADDLEVMYPTLSRMSITSILRHGLNNIFKALIRRCDTYINSDNQDDGFFMYFCGAKNVSQFTKARIKTRFLLANKKNKPKHEGVYYFYVSQNKKADFDAGKDLLVNCTRYLEELHIGKHYAAHIYQYTVPDCAKQGFLTTINCNTEGILHYESYIDNHFKRI